MSTELDLHRAEQLARDMGVSSDRGLVETLDETQVRMGMYDDLRDRLSSIVGREPTLYGAEEWSWIQAHCRSVRDHPHHRLHVFPAYSLSLKVPTEKTLRARDGAIIPVTQKRLPEKPAPEPGVAHLDPVRMVTSYALDVLRGIERMILGKSRKLPDGRVVQGLTNHPERQRFPALDWSAEGRDESLKRLVGMAVFGGTIFYATRFADRRWSESTSISVAERIRQDTRTPTYRSHYLEEGEAVFIGRSRVSWLSGPKWPHPRGLPVVFEGLPPTVVERRPEDFDSKPPPEKERGTPWLTVMAVAGPWIPEPDSIVHFGGDRGGASDAGL